MSSRGCCWEGPPLGAAGGLGKEAKAGPGAGSPNPAAPQENRRRMRAKSACCESRADPPGRLLPLPVCRGPGLGAPALAAAQQQTYLRRAGRSRRRLQGCRGAAAGRGRGMARGRCAVDVRHGRQRLMSIGLSLVILGHLNLVLGAIVHGSVLRHVARPDRTVTSEYAAANIIAVLSGILSIATGIMTILVSRNLSGCSLSRILLVISLANTLISGACCVGLAVAVSVTVASGGRHLLAGCNSSALPADAHIVTNECPFDTTRIYDTALVLWFASLVMAAVEAGLSAWCCVASLFLCGIGPCAVSYQEGRVQEAVPWTEAAEEACEGRPRYQLLVEVTERHC